MENKLNFDYYNYQDFEHFLDSLPAKDAAKLANRINEIERRGMLEAQKMQWVKKLNDNLFEIRSKLASNIQRAVYFHLENNNYVITHGFTKKTPKTPKKELRKGQILKKLYLKQRKDSPNNE